MTDNEIIKALECCSTYKGKCTDCPAFVKVDRSNCKKVLLGAVEIINRLQAENERLQEAIDEQDIEISRLYKRIDETKAEAYTDFAESLKKDFDNPRIQKFGLDFVKFLKNIVDNRLKELVGEGK
jgi:predicted RNase H-like nuclease (RuvC/YqgF family)